MTDLPTVHTSYADAFSEAVTNGCGLYESKVDGELRWVATTDVRLAEKAVVQSLGITTRRLKTAEMQERAAQEFKARVRGRVNERGEGRGTPNRRHPAPAAEHHSPTDVPRRPATPHVPD